MESASAPVQSQFLRIDRCEHSQDVILVFSHIGYPAGKFAMTNALAGVSATRVYVNCHANSWYQRGLPGASSSIDETVAVLQRILDQLSPRRVFTVGMSMGGYAALLFGLKLECDAVLAYTAEVLLGEQYSRSYYMNGLKQYDYKYVCLAPLLRQNRRTKIYLTYGAYDLIDLSLLWTVADTFSNPLHRVHLASGDHKVTFRFNVALTAQRLLSKGALTQQDIHPSLCLPLTLTEEDCLRYKELQRVLLLKDTAAAYVLLNPIAHRSSHDAFFFGKACMDSKRFSEAKEAFLHSISMDPYSAEAYHLLGLTLHVLHEYEEAVQAYCKALRLDEGLSGTHYRLAMTYLQLQNEVAAEACLRRAVELHPGFSDAKAQLNALLERQGRMPS